MQEIIFIQLPQEININFYGTQTPDMQGIQSSVARLVKITLNKLCEGLRVMLE